MLLIYLMYFVVVTLLFQLLSKHLLAALYLVSDLLTIACKHINDSLYTRPTLLALQLLTCFAVKN